jgi:type IV pilus assembly protein PilA
MRNREAGFNLLELTVVLAIVSFLSMLAMPSFMRFFAKAKRTEAYTQLRALYIAEKAYFAEKGMYTTNLSGTDSLGWHADGQLSYTYGFGKGTEGKNYVEGSLKAPASSLKGTYANAAGFKIGAAARVSGSESDMDFLTIDQNGTITIVSDGSE